MAIGFAGIATLCACKALVYGSSNYETVNESRASDQVHFEDSLKVFFASYPNPYPDKQFMWFAVFVEGSVEMRVHNIESDSLEATYTFAKQDIPVYTIAMHEHPERLVKCVLFVDGRMKCAKMYPSWYPIQIPQFKTQYTISTQ